MQQMKLTLAMMAILALPSCSSPARTETLSQNTVPGERKNLPPSTDLQQSSSAIDMGAQTIGRAQDASVGANAATFQIIELGSQDAKLRFSGSHKLERWTETYAVAASDNGDIRSAVVKKMVAIIRRSYSADFNWNSTRLGRVVRLSVRPEDNRALEAFLMEEMFDNKVPLQAKP